MTRLLHLVVAAATIACAACGSSTPTSPTTSTTSSTTTSTTTTSTGPSEFDMTLPPGGSGFYSINLATAGVVRIDLASVMLSGKASPIAAALQLGVGTPAGEGCTVTQAIMTTPSLASQFSPSLPQGISCVSVADTAGALTAPALVTLRYTLP